jgi:hypothetical protein
VPPKKRKKERKKFKVLDAYCQFAFHCKWVILSMVYLGYPPPEGFLLHPTYLDRIAPC